MESVKVNNCPVCNSELTSDLIHLDLKDPFHVVEDKFRYEQCKGCDSWILNPRPRLEYMGKFYEQDFLFDLDEKEAPKKD